VDPCAEILWKNAVAPWTPRANPVEAR